MSQQSLIKKHILGRPQEALVFHPRGFDGICLRELKQILATTTLPAKLTPELKVGAGITVSNLSFRSLLELSLRSRTARDILWILERARAASIKEIIRLVQRVRWDAILRPGTEISLRTTLEESRFNHEGKLKDVVAEVLMNAGFVVAAEASQMLDVRLIRNQLQLALSTGGEPLYRRGYKVVLRGSASIKEDLAACLLQECVTWLGDFSVDAIFVPFAGSGTLGFEAILSRSPVSASIFPRDYSILQLACTPQASVRHLEKELGARLSSEKIPPVILWDTARSAEDMLTKNARAFSALLKKAGGRVQIETKREDFFSETRWPQGKLFLPLNPPFGNRLQTARSTTKLYTQIGKTLTARQSNHPAGFVLAPDKLSESALVKELATFETKSTAIMHGGKVIRLIFFR